MKAKKTKRAILKLLVVLCSAFVPMPALGQTTYVWTNQNPGLLVAGDLVQATNWSPNGVPNPQTGPNGNGVYGDEMQFDGRTTGPLAVTQGASVPQPGGGNYSYGLRIHLMSNQTSSVTIQSPIAVSGGMRMNYFTIDAGAGSFNLGDHSTNCLDILAGYLNGQILGFTNNSATPCVINESVRWRLGGAGAHPFVFAGTGDWIVNNHMRSANSSAVLVQKSGPGTMTWAGTNNINSAYPDHLGPITIGGGMMILKSSDLVNAGAGGPSIVHNGTLLKFDWTPALGIVTAPDFVPGNISGTGPIQLSAGTVTFAGTNTFSGDINLTGGELIAGRAENVGISGPLGIGGTISFNGGTLGFSTYNTFDYSSRFSTAAGQAYSIDTVGQIVTLATGLGSSGGTLAKIGGGTLTLSGASSYDGVTTISAGKLVFQSSKTGSGDITVADGAILGVTATGTQITPGTLTLGTSTGCTVEFNNVNSTTTAPIAANVLSSAGTVTVNINSGTFASGGIYPLLTWASGSAPTVNLGGLNGAAGNLSITDNVLKLNISSIVPAPTLNFTQTGSRVQLFWTGSFKLQWQANNLSMGLSTNWVNYPGGGSNPVTVPISATSGTVFFRLVSP